MKKIENRPMFFTVLAIVSFLVFGRIVVAISESAPMCRRSAYKEIQAGRYDYAALDVVGDKSTEGRVLYRYARFLESNGEYLDVIEAEEVVEDVPYFYIYEDAETYLQPDSSSKYYDEIHALYQHVEAVCLKAKDTYIPKEAAKYKGQLPQEGMKIIYLDETRIGQPSSIRSSTFGLGEDYVWYVSGVQIFYAQVVDGYVLNVYDTTDRLTAHNSQSDSSSGSLGGSSSSGKHSSNSSYDDGYDDVWDDDDYDVDRYNSDPDYADGVDDAMDEMGDDW